MSPRLTFLPSDPEMTKTKSTSMRARRTPKVTRNDSPTAVTNEMTRGEVLRRVEGLDVDRRNSTVCALVGHSRIQTYCFGYFNCARCGDVVGDSLASSYPGAKTAVVVGHRCPQCDENAKVLTWRDRLFVPPSSLAGIKR